MTQEELANELVRVCQKMENITNRLSRLGVDPREMETINIQLNTYAEIAKSLIAMSETMRPRS